MQRFTGAVAMMTLTALLGNVTGSALAAADRKRGADPRDTNSGAHNSGKGSENSNAQWSADPERGWVRTNNRQHSRENNGSGERGKQDRGKWKGKGEAKKF